MMVPSQKVIYIWVSLLIHKKEKMEHIVVLCKHLKMSRTAKIREVAKVIGVLVSSFPAVDYGRIFYREIEKEKIKVLRNHYGNFESEMLISHSTNIELEWWIENIHTQVRHIDRAVPL